MRLEVLLRYDFPVLRIVCDVASCVSYRINPKGGKNGRLLRKSLYSFSHWDLRFLLQTFHGVKRVYERSENFASVLYRKKSYSFLPVTITPHHIGPNHNTPSWVYLHGMKVSLDENKLPIDVIFILFYFLFFPSTFICTFHISYLYIFLPRHSVFFMFSYKFPLNFLWLCEQLKLSDIYLEVIPDQLLNCCVCVCVRTSSSSIKFCQPCSW